ncbi:MAG: D-glycero-beta-D-manno-heptose-7-phosphate kinase [Dongiaceae bacterium]
MINKLNISSKLETWLPQLEAGRVMVIGDAMVDRYTYGKVERISPEAPIPVLHVSHESTMLGGAGNVLRNVVALKANAAFISLAGDDSTGMVLEALLHQQKAAIHLVKDFDRPTSLKVRYVANNQQIMRADRENAAPISAAQAQSLMAHLHQEIGRVDVILLSDYAKGLFTPYLAGQIIKLAREKKIPVIVDPKGRDYSRYKGATLLSPNVRELMEATGMPVSTSDEIVAAAKHLIAQIEVESILVTRSQDGMTLVAKSGEVHHLHAQAREVYDVSGAGDTAIATLAAALAAKADLLTAATLANIAAGIVVGKVGTAVVFPEEILAALHGQETLGAEQKMATLENLLDKAAAWRRQGLKIGFTNGVFDLIHPGHVSLLREARAACDRLVVALNTDSSVKRLKGPSRPVQNEAARAQVMASFADVDAVILFDEDTPLSLIEAVRPDVLVKAKDYTIDKVVGADFVQSYGGRVMLAEFAPGFSTTGTIKKAAG